jgi:hypothetical protein
MGSLLGGGGGGSGGGGGFLSGLLGGLPDPLGVGKMLGITGGDEGQGQMGAPQGPAPMPPGMQFMGGQQPQSGVSGVPQDFGKSPMSPTGFGIGGGGRR